MVSLGVADALCYNVLDCASRGLPQRKRQSELDEKISPTEDRAQRTDRFESVERVPRTGFARAFAALRHRNFRLFFAGQLVSLSGTWMQSIAQGWLVLQLTNSAFLLGVVSALQFLPVLLFSLFGGVVADRFPKRRLLLVTQSCAMVLAFALAVLTSAGLVQVWHVMILATLLGVVNAVDMPTRQAFVVEMVGKEDLMNAIALNSSLFNGARVIGPALGGILIGWIGLAACFYFNGLSFLAVIAGLLAMRVQSSVGASAIRQSIWMNISEGLCYIRQTPLILLLMSQIGLLAVFGMNFNVVIPVLARDVLGTEATGYGLLMSAMGVGSFFGALSLAYLSRTPRLSPLLIAAFFFGMLEVFLAGVRWYPLSALTMIAIGFFFVNFGASANTLIQTTVPDRLRGRVMSVYSLVFAGSSPIGSMFAGTVAYNAGPVAPLIVGGLICAIGATVGWRLSRREGNIANVS